MRPSRLSVAVLSVAGCGAPGVQGLQWVLGHHGDNCVTVCSAYAALCDEDPKIWPKDASGFASVVSTVTARLSFVYKLATSERKVQGASAELAEPPGPLCLHSGAEGFVIGDMAPHNPSASPVGVCAWQALPPPPPLKRCSVPPPGDARRFCPCKPRVLGTPSGQPCANKEACLAIVDRFLDQQPRAFGLLQVRAEEGSLGGGPCGPLCQLPGPCPEGPARCRHDTYDSAVAAIYYTKRGKLDKAREILDAFVELLYPVNVELLRPQTNDTLYKGQSGRMLTLLASSYNKANRPEAGNYQAPYVTDGGVDTGNNAWVGLAFSHFAAAAGSACHATVAHDILRTLRRGACHDRLGGFLGHLPPYKANYRATEHNVDVFALAKMLEQHEEMAHARRFVHGMYGQSVDHHYKGTYATGTGAAKPCDLSVPAGAPVAADTTYWNLLADADANESRVNEALRFALHRPTIDPTGRVDTSGLWVSDTDLIWMGGGVPPLLNGTRFSTFGTGVQWENTAGAVMALLHYQDTYGRGGDLQVQSHIDEARSSLRQLLGMYGGVPSSVLGGNYGSWQSGERRTLYPGGTDTGMGWPYLRYLATAPTAWTGLLLLYQATASDEPNPAANPYAAPVRPIPMRTDLSCLPPMPKSPIIHS